MPHEKAIGFAKKAAGFAVRPLVDVPTLPGGRAGRLVEQAIEGSTSPIGLLSTALLPVTGGASLGLRGGAGVAARLATRGAAEIGTSAAGGLAAEETAKRVQNAPGFIRYGAPLVAGFAGSATAASGLNRAALRLEPGQPFGFYPEPPSSTYMQGGIKGSPATSYETLLPLGQSKSLLDPSAPRASVTTKVAATPAREPIGTPNELRRDFSKIKRGQQALISRVQMEARLGRLTPDAVPPAVEFAKSLPEPYLKQLGSSFSVRDAGRTAGQYKPDTSIMTIFSAVLNRNPANAEGTIIHEIAHHLEQFVDDAEYGAIQNTWKATTKPKYDQWVNGVDELVKRLGAKVPKRADVDEKVAALKRLPGIEGAEAEDKLALLEQQFTYAERGGINEWFAEQLRAAELDRQAGAVVPGSLKQFLGKVRNIVAGYSPAAAPNVLRRLQGLTSQP